MAHNDSVPAIKVMVVGVVLKVRVLKKKMADAHEADGSNILNSPIYDRWNEQLVGPTRPFALTVSPPYSHG